LFPFSAASLSVSATVQGVGATTEQKWSFSQMVQTTTVSFVGSTSVTLKIDAAQCSADREVPFLNFWQCFSSDLTTVCQPPVPWGMWAATKGLHYSFAAQPNRPSELHHTWAGLAALAILFKVILVVLYAPLFSVYLSAHYDLFTIPCSFIQKKQTGCSICGLFWLSM
jgi:hypothetical protein